MKTVFDSSKWWGCPFLEHGNVVSWAPNLREEKGGLKCLVWKSLARQCDLSYHILWTLRRIACRFNARFSRNWTFFHLPAPQRLPVASVARFARYKFPYFWHTGRDWWKHGQVTHALRKSRNALWKRFPPQLPYSAPQITLINPQ